MSWAVLGDYGACVTLSLPVGTYDALIFDCDGTLVDSMPLHHRAWRAALAEHGARFDFHWELFMSRAGLAVSETVAELNLQFGESLDPDLVAARQHQHYASLVPEVQPLEAIAELARAQFGRVPMAVASGGDKEMVLQALESTGLRSLFRHVVCRVDVPRGKPHPDMFLHCAELLGVAPQRCVVFEDGRPGIEAAKAAKMGWVLIDLHGQPLETSYD